MDQLSKFALMLWFMWVSVLWFLICINDELRRMNDREDRARGEE